MRVKDILTTDAKDGRYAELIRAACDGLDLQHAEAAVAYATQTGVAELCGVLDQVASWRGARKRWLVGIDYCRTDPQALAHLHSLPRSEVRIHDGLFVARRSGCPPRVSFHPKLYLFRGRTGIGTVVGSGNLSQTGLRIGIEAAASVRCVGARPMAPVTAWYRRLWEAATPLRDIEDAYAREYAAFENRLRPTPIDDDVIPVGAGTHGQLTAAQLRQLRVCEHLWIEAGNLHLNRGPERPGNQLMLKRNTRVYFGFQAFELEPDTAIGSVAIRCDVQERTDCSLRFSNNSMDVLTLPIPGDGGPDKYDREVILFRRIGVRRFELSLARAGDVQQWRQESRRIGGLFQMTSGRRWGVF